MGNLSMVSSALSFATASRGEYKPGMSDTKEPWVQLATRIPKTLRREMKLHCVTAETTVLAFIVEAIEQKLARDEKKRKRA